MKNTITSLVVLSFINLNLMASEPDNFTVRNEPMSDSLGWLNDKMNSALDDVAAKTNSCDRFELQAKLYKDLGGVFIANIEKWSKEDPYAIQFPIEKSIYSTVKDEKGDHSFRRLTKFGAYYTQGLLRVNNINIGDDKLGHFFQLGYSMYYSVEWKKDHKFKDIRDYKQKAAAAIALDNKFIKKNDFTETDDIVGAFAQFQEDGEWGMKADYVKSYGDMAANYEGYLFWKSLTEGSNPYFKCDGNRFAKVRNFDWNEYINPGWDEAINCSEFHPKIKDRVNAEIAKRNIGACPVAPDSCADAYKKMGAISKYILHPRCLDAAKKILNAEK